MNDSVIFSGSTMGGIDIRPAVETRVETRAEYCRRRLLELAGQRREISEKSGVPYHTLNKVVRPQRKTREDTIEKIYSALVTHFPEVSSPVVQ